jgi:glycosyltransferase involved in cell wall biosynthesis
VPQQRSVCLLSSAQLVDDARFLHREAASLARAGYEVTLVGLKRTPAQDAVPNVNIITVPRGRGIRKPDTLRGVYAAARRSRARTFQCFDPWALAIGLLIKRGKPSVRVVYEATESYPRIQLERRDRSVLMRWPSYVAVRLLEYLALRRADWIIDTSPTRARRFARHGRRVSIVGNLPPRKFAQESGQERKPWIVSTGLITRHRGFDVLLKAFALIAPRLPEVRLRVSGRFAPGEGLEAWSRDFLKQQGLESRVDFLGWITAYECMFTELRSCSVGVLLFQPDWWNDYTNLPNKLFDFMATGLGVIASRFPDMGRVVEQTGCGWLVDPTDPAAVASVLEYALTHPEECRLRGEAGRRAVLAGYNWEAAEQVLLEIHDRLSR